MSIYINENLKRLRREKGTTQQALADFLGVSFQSVSRWERGECYPDITLLSSIGAFFEVSVDELLSADKAEAQRKINEYLELYDTMRLSDLPVLMEKYEKAARELPTEFEILIRYMELLQEVKIRNLSLDGILSGKYKKASEEIERIYNNINKYCTQDNIRIWAKRVMISHLLWKFDCICDEKGQYGTDKQLLEKVREISDTLPEMCDSREIAGYDRENWSESRKHTIEELLFHLYRELYGFCYDYAAEKRILQFESLLHLSELIYTDDFGKNCYNRLYALGHLGHLYHQTGDDDKALLYLKKAASYAKELESTGEKSDIAKRNYNFGTIYREATATKFMKTVMTQHYPLSEAFKGKQEFKAIIDLLS